jgi:hypothetical protein
MSLVDGLLSRTKSYELSERSKTMETGCSSILIARIITSEEIVFDLKQSSTRL